MTLARLPPWAVDLLERAPVGYLGLLDDADRPRVQPVTFAIANGSAWTAIDDKPKQAREPARVRRLRRRPEAALTVDRYDDDWSRLAWVQLLGTMDVLELDGAEAGLAALAAKYEPYRDRPPRGPVLRLNIARALHWRAADG